EQVFDSVIGHRNVDRLARTDLPFEYAERTREVVGARVGGPGLAQARRIDEVRFAIHHEHVLGTDVAVAESCRVQARERVEKHRREPTSLARSEVFDRAKVGEVFDHEYAEFVVSERFDGFRCLEADLADPPGGGEFVFGHRERVLETLEKPLGAARKHPEVPTGREHVVDQRVLWGNYLHEPLITNDTRRREPVVRIEELDAGDRPIIASRDLAADGLQIRPRHAAPNESTERHTGGTGRDHLYYLAEIDRRHCRSRSIARIRSWNRVIGTRNLQTSSHTKVGHGSLPVRDGRVRGV